MAPWLGMDEFVERMRALCARGLPSDEVQRLLAGSSIEPASLERYVRFEAGRYTRHLVFKSADVELLVLCWAQGSRAPRHGHEGERCWARVERGRLRFTAWRLGVILHEFFLGGEHKAFIMELPLYHLPNWKTIGQSISLRCLDFLKTAGSVILVVSVVLWFLSTYPGGSIHTSYLAGVGRWLTPIGGWMGMDWRMMVALLTSFVRKENTIPTLAVLFGSGEQNASLSQLLPGSLSTASALAFLTVQILFIPCLATVASIRQETGSWFWTVLDVILILVISMAAGVMIFHVARIFM